MPVLDVDAVILAAGYSSRCEKYKMALDIDGKPLIVRCIEGFVGICKNIIVVSGYNADIVQALLSDFANDSSVQCVYNEKYSEGMFTSIKVGINQVSSSRFFLTPGDHPFISSNALHTLLSYNDDIVIPQFQGRKGHPALIRSTLIADILQELDSYNLRDFIHKKSHTITNVSDPGVLFDIDTIDDYNLSVNRQSQDNCSINDCGIND